MIYFIPSWYEDADWSFSRYDPNWYTPVLRMESDETVKYLQMLRHDHAVMLMALGYQPQLRHWLHRQNIYGVPMWSCFDAILQIKTRQLQPLSFRQLPWEENISFVYTNFAVTAIADGEMRYAISFGQDGNMISIDAFQNGVLSQRTYFDDRGFASSIVRYKEGTAYCQDFYNEKQEYRMRLSLVDGSVTIQGDPCFDLIGEFGEKTLHFQKKVYPRMEELVREVTLAYIQLIQSDAVFCVALSSAHEKLIAAMPPSRLILTWYQDRYSLQSTEHQSTEHAQSVCNRVDAIVADTEGAAQAISARTDTAVYCIAPYCTDDINCEHATIPSPNLLVLADGVKHQELTDLISHLASYAAAEPAVSVTLLTQSPDRKRSAALAAQIKSTLQTLEQYDLYERFHVVHCCDETDCIRLLRQQRVLIDMGAEHNQYLQTLALIYGIPQIVKTSSPYVVHGENGLLIRSTGELGDALNYFIKDLSHWNHAVVASEAIGKAYTKEALIKQWNEVFAKIGVHSYSSNRGDKLEAAF